jgi:hypothetical protein
VSESSVSSAAPLVERVLAGGNQSLQRLAAEGLLPLPPEELVPLQVHLAFGQDAEIAGIAKRSLNELEPRIVREVIRSGTRPEVVEYFALNFQHPSVTEAILQLRDVSPSLLRVLAQSISPELQEILLLRQDLIVEHREILEALGQNPSLSSYARRRILEYREHLFGEARKAKREAEQVDEDEISEEELQAAVEEVRTTVDATGERDEITGLSESQIKAMTPSMRMKLARGASRTLRSILVKDQNPTVACAVLTASGITEQEIEQISNNRNIAEEVLTLIANRRDWNGKYQIMHNLVKNPRTPVPIAMRNIPRLSLRDLGQLKMDRNVSDAVRQHALRVHRAKSAR